MPSVMTALQDLDRLREIVRVLVRHGFGEVVQRLGLSRLRVGPTIDPGVPWMAADGARAGLFLALKSGNFGSKDFFTKAWNVLGKAS